MRGFWDGDGTICINSNGYPMIRVGSSRNFCQQAKDLFMRECGISDVAITEYDNGFHTVCWTALKDLQPTLTWMYADSILHMSRKMEMARLVYEAANLEDCKEFIRQKWNQVDTIIV